MRTRQTSIAVLFLFVLLSPSAIGQQSKKTRVVIPRALRSESDAKECLAAAEKNLKDIQAPTRISPPDKPERLSDCYAIIDQSRHGYSKFYPDGVRLRLQVSVRAGHVTVFSPKVARPAVLVTLQPLDIQLTHQTEDPRETIELKLTRQDERQPFRREPSGWNAIQSPDEVERFCLRLFEDYQLLSR